MNKKPDMLTSSFFPPYIHNKSLFFIRQDQLLTTVLIL